MAGPTVDHGVCVGCGYELTGLPMAGRCPECGKPYDAASRQGMDNGLANRQQRSQRQLARARTVTLGVIALLIIGLSGLLSITGMSSHPLRPLAVGAVFAGLFALGSLTSYLYEKPE